ncbi:mitogen-activated protein kinase-binding protein 1-like isoform X3 [Syngnathus scovelli]|uniref:mitogen-activated protein kinase-binding protein 1-like isoform X3 n=1 Tax=Syngnathus scovelli TaxID=161590 RepID=UPI00210F9733|nr:mitogen-activated protein kinase-binding protein 1-like isoform X3 [Syngnathus scovelli]
MPADGLTFKSRIRKLLRSPSGKLGKDRGDNLASKVTLEKVLGITALGNSCLACDPKTGLVAYPAGCVVVLLNPRKSRQQHLINTSRKTITALSFSHDGKYLVTGESGHLPAVRLWDVSEHRQVSELQKHEYGVSCVAFSPDGKHIVSVGNQHDMMVNVWAWKKDVVVAANKVSSKVTGVSFAEDSSYFVTVGNRHVKFWYLDHCKASKASTPVPLLGRSGLLGELRNNFFCDVACGRGQKSDSTFCVTFSGLLCEFNGNRMLDKWVDLQTSVAQSLSLSSDRIFCSCADGTVRVFSPLDLRFVCTLPRPHPLGVDVASVTQASHLLCSRTDARYPDAMAVTYDPVSRWLSCVYADHSVFVWDVADLTRVAKVHSALFHAACVWDLEMFPDIPEETAASLWPGTFLSCSSDSTIRLWHVDERSRVHSRNILSSVSLTTPKSNTYTINTVIKKMLLRSQDLLKIIYTSASMAALQEAENLTNPDGPAAESRAVVRTICLSPDGKHLASGDRNGMLRIHNLSSMEEILKVEAHDAEILCLEYSKPKTGLQFLATASRDRLIHVLDAAADYGLVQTLDEHSSSITAVRFAAVDAKVRLISCGADKSIYFRTAHTSDSRTEFRRSHHTVRKTTLYDMAVDPSCKHAAVGCQDRCIRIFNVNNGKQKKLYKGSLSDDGSLLRVQIDPSGQYVAASCSNKNISIFDFHTGECVATMFGHSEIVTSLRFTNDCKHLISVSGDSCIFVWRLTPELTISMRQKLFQLQQPFKSSAFSRREAHSAPALVGLSSDSERDDEDAAAHRDSDNSSNNTSTDSSHGEEDAGASEDAPDWEPAKPAVPLPVVSRRPRRRWSRRRGSLEQKVKSMLDLRQLDTFTPNEATNTDARSSTPNLHEPALTSDRPDKNLLHQPIVRCDWLSSGGVESSERVGLSREDNKDDGALQDSDKTATDSLHRKCQVLNQSQDSYSPDSACSMGYDSRGTSPDGILDESADNTSLSLDSSDDEEEEETLAKTNVAIVDKAGREDFLRKNFETLGDTCSAVEPSRAPRLSMSSRFLARGHHNRGGSLFSKLQAKETDGNFSHKPPVSKVRPLMENGQSRTPGNKSPVSPSATQGPRIITASTVIPRPQKKNTMGSHIWRFSTPPSKPSLPDRTTRLHKSLSVQNLTVTSPRSPLPSSEHREWCKRPQYLLLDQDPLKASSSCVSSPSPGSPQSPHSYMSPTASSIAKSSRSSSVGEGVHPGLDLSPFPKARRSWGDLDVAETPWHPLASVSPTRTRIPQPKQPLSPRRSLCLELKATSTVGPTCDVTSYTGTAENNIVSTSERKQDVGPPSEALPLVAEHPLPHPGGPPPTDLSFPTTSFPFLLPPTPPLPFRRHSASRWPPLACVSPSPVASCQCHAGNSITLDMCKQAASELHCSLRRTVTLYAEVLQRPPECGEEARREMVKVLSGALTSAKVELDPLPSCWPSNAKSEGDKALALLEQYAELLLKSVEKKLDSKM